MTARPARHLATEKPVLPLPGFGQPVGTGLPRPGAFEQASGQEVFRYGFWLKLLIVSAFLPEDLSLYAGDFRIPLVRLLIIGLSIVATARYLNTAGSPRSVCVPSDFFAVLAGVWIVLSGVVIDGADIGLKTGGALALEFSGAYYVFRRLLGPVDSSVQIARFACKVVVVVCCLAVLDPLTGRLLSHEIASGLTGYNKPYPLATDSFFRNGLVRAMGPMEHSILFGMVCAWFSTLALLCFRFSLLGIGVPVVALIGILCSQSKGPLMAYMIGLGLAVYYVTTPTFAARWKVVLAGVALLILAVFIHSANPVSTLLQLGGLDPDWYRQAIWATAGPAVLQSPIFGIGVLDDWDWQASDVLVGPTVDALWLRASMTSGIPGSVLVFLTMVGAFWLGPVDKSVNLTEEEQRLSVALGIATGISVLLGFTVHFWGTCWIVIGIFAGIRANLAEAAKTAGRIDDPPRLESDPAVLTVGDFSSRNAHQVFPRLQRSDVFRK